MTLERRYWTILAGTDFSPISIQAIHAAADLAKLTGTKHLHILHARPPLPMFASAAPTMGLDGGYIQQLDEEAQKAAQQHLSRIEIPRLASEIHRAAVLGNAVDVLTAAAKELNANLVVVASHGRTALRRAMLGSVTSALLRSVGCPVLVVGPARASLAKIRRVVAAVDLSASSADIIERAAELADAAGATLEVLHVVRLHPAITDDFAAIELTAEERARAIETTRAAIGEIVARLAAPPTLAVEVRVELGAASDAVVHTSARSDLVVIGTSGHGVLQRAFLGSTAGKVAAEAHCPVLVVPSSRS